MKICENISPRPRRAGLVAREYTKRRLFIYIFSRCLASAHADTPDSCQKISNSVPKGHNNNVLSINLRKVIPSQFFHAISNWK
jgi:hypothetical protein